jgi:hypothetical protein
MICWSHWFIYILVRSYFVQLIQLPIVDVLRYKRNFAEFLPWLCIDTLPSKLGWIAKGKPNSHQPLELWDVHTSKSGIEALPKHKIEESILDIHNCVGTPQTSLRNY